MDTAGKMLHCTRRQSERQTAFGAGGFPNFQSPAQRRTSEPPKYLPSGRMPGNIRGLSV